MTDEHFDLDREFTFGEEENETIDGDTMENVMSKAHALIKDKAHWIKWEEKPHPYALVQCAIDWVGSPIDPTDSRAVAFDALGAIISAAGGRYAAGYRLGLQALARSILHPDNDFSVEGEWDDDLIEMIMGWNNGEFTDHAEVVEVFERAIPLFEEERGRACT